MWTGRARRRVAVLALIRRLAVLVVIGALGGAGASAAPHKILVLPADGNADPAARAKLTTEIAKLAHGLPGEVSVGEATFADTALAVGCDPHRPGCGDDVMATLGVDELVWATAGRDGGKTRVVAWRAARGAPARKLDLQFTTADPDARTKLDGWLAPLFGPAATSEPAVEPDRPASGPGAPAGAGSPPPPATPPSAAAVDDDRHDRNLGLALATGGGVALVVGIVLWASAASAQDQINHHPIQTVADFTDLRALEDRAQTYAITGDLAVLAGATLGGIGAYYLVRHYNRPRVALRGGPIAHGFALSFELIGGL